MFPLSLFFPLADIVFLTPPKREPPPQVPDWALPQNWPAAPGWLLPAALLVALALLVVIVARGLRAGRRATAQAKAQRWILVDGSNVMHWQDNRPGWAPLRQVVNRLVADGYTPGVVFDANAGYKLGGAYMNDRALARALGLPEAQVLVAPKGTPADDYILQTARLRGIPVVTNDRYRDWAETYPEVATPGFLIRGGVRDGALWLDRARETA